MLGVVVSAVIGAVVVLVYIYTKIKKGFRVGNDSIPGPKHSNSVDGHLQEIASSGSFHQFLEKYHRQYGPIIRFWYGSRMCVSTASHALFQQHAPHFDRPAELYMFLEPFFGIESIAFTNDDEGRRRHSTYSKAYGQSSVKSFFFIFNKLGKDLVTKWTLKQNERLLLQDEMFQIAIKAILESTFGDEFENEKLVADVKEAYDYCWGIAEKIMIGDILEKGSARQEAFNAKINMLNGMITGVLSRRRELTVSEKSKLPIDAVLGLDLKESTAVSDLLTIFVAGFHSSALLMIWCIYYLATHQEIQSRVRQEVLSVLENCDQVTTDMASKMNYLQQVLKETLRVSLVVPLSARVHHSDITLDGYRVPAETPVIHAMGVVLHDETVYPQPLKFDPDRFSPDNERLLPPFSFEPFGFGGTRKCPGYNLSYGEATVILSHLLRSFKIELAYPQEAEPVFGFVTKMKDNLWIKVVPLMM